MFELVFAMMLQTPGGVPEMIEAPVPAEVAAAESLPESVLRRRERHQLRCRDRALPGTRINNRVCMSTADLDRQREETRAIADSAHRSLLTSNPGVDMCRGASC